MWMLFATVRLEISLTSAGCSSQCLGRFPFESACRERVAPTRAELLRLADELWATVIRESVHCEKGTDL